MPSRASIGGHPLHPAVVPVPIGFLLGALLGNIVFTVTDILAWYDVAFWAAWAGVASGLFAALLGFVDYVTVVGPRERPAATMHMLLNVGALVLFAAAGMLAMDRGAAEGGELGWLLTLQVAALALLAVGGWLGGELVYRFGLAVHPADPDRVPEPAAERGQEEARA